MQRNKFEEIVRKTFVESAKFGSILKTYDVKKLKTVPGAYRPGSKGTKTREDTLSEAVDGWPHLFIYKSQRGGGYQRLDIDLPKFDRLIEQFGADKFGGGFNNWESVWFCQEAINASADWDFEKDESTTVATSRVPAGTIRELFNYVGLKEKIDNGEIDDPMLLDYCNAGERVPNSDYAYTPVAYYQKCGRGRRFATRPAGQPMTKQIKKLVFNIEPDASFGAGRRFMDAPLNQIVIS